MVKKNRLQLFRVTNHLAKEAGLKNGSVNTGIKMAGAAEVSVNALH